jgi:hypothetical protein
MSREMKSRRVDPDLYYNSDLRRLEKHDRHGWFALRGLLIGVWMYADANGQFEWDVDRMHMAMTSRDMHRSRFNKLLDLLLEQNYIHRYNKQGEFDPDGEFCHVRTWRWQIKAVSQYEAAEVAIDCPCEERKTQGGRKPLMARAKRERKAKVEEPADPNYGKNPTARRIAIFATERQAGSRARCGSIVQTRSG